MAPTTSRETRTLDLSGIRISGKSLAPDPLNALDRLVLMGQREDIEGILRAVATLPDTSFIAWPSSPKRLTVGAFVRATTRAAARAGGQRSAGEDRDHRVSVEEACEYFGFPLARSRRTRISSLDAEARARLLAALTFASAGHWMVLDDPFSGVSGQARAGIRGRLLEACSGYGRGLILATSNILDAAVVGGTAVMLEKGQIADSGPLAAQLHEPRSNLAAGFAGVNVFSGLARKNWLSIGHSRVRARTELDGKVFVTIPTNATRMSFDEFDPIFTSDSVFEALVVSIRDRRRMVQLVLSPADTEVGLAMTADLLDFSAAVADPSPNSDVLEQPTEDRAAEWGILHSALGTTVAEQLARVKVGTRLFVEVDTDRMHAYSVEDDA